MGNVSKRQARIENRDNFVSAITEWQLEHANNFAVRGGIARDASFKVVIRKRPIHEAELKRGEFDVVYCDQGGVVIHDCRLKADMKHMFVRHHLIEFENIYGERCSTEQIYAEQVQPLVSDLLNSPSSLGTVFFFGQTGSGKTFTSNGILRLIGHGLFRRGSAGNGNGNASASPFTVSCFEITGTACKDLLQDKEEVFLREGSDGQLNVRGLLEATIRTPEELSELLQLAREHRASSATQVHDASSRSHLVISLKNMRNGATFMLLDLAGTERNENNMYHDQKQIKETAEINSSLMALKDCIRKCCSEEEFVPFRNSKLTQLLKPCFTTRTARTLVIATVSPSCNDTEHTISTLSNVCLMTTSNPEAAMRISEEDVLDENGRQVSLLDEVPVAPAKWSHEQVSSWLASVERGKYKHLCRNLGPTMDGKVLTRMNKARFVSDIALGKEADGSCLYDALRKEMDRIAVAEAKRRQQIMSSNRR